MSETKSVSIHLDDIRGAHITEESVPYGSGTITRIIIGVNGTVTIPQLERVLNLARHCELESTNVD